MTIKHKSRGGSRRRINYKGGQPNQFNPGAPYSGADGSGMGPNIMALGASGGSRYRRKGGSMRLKGGRRLKGGQPNQFNSGAPYSGADGSGMGPNIMALGASGGSRRRRKGGRRAKGGGMEGAVPIGLLGIQSWFKGMFDSKKEKD